MKKRPFRKNQVVRATQHKGDHPPHLEEACVNVEASRFRIDRCYPDNSDSGWIVDVVLLDRPQSGMFTGDGRWVLRPTSAFEIVLAGYDSNWFRLESEVRK